MLRVSTVPTVQQCAAYIRMQDTQVVVESGNTEFKTLYVFNKYTEIDFFTFFLFLVATQNPKPTVKEGRECEIVVVAVDFVHL